MKHDLKRLKGILNSIREKKIEQGAVTLQNADGGGAGSRVQGNFDYVDSPEAIKREEVLHRLSSCTEQFLYAYEGQTNEFAKGRNVKEFGSQF